MVDPVVLPVFVKRRSMVGYSSSRMVCEAVALAFWANAADDMQLNSTAKNKVLILLGFNQAKKIPIPEAN